MDDKPPLRVTMLNSTFGFRCFQIANVKIQLCKGIVLKPNLRFSTKYDTAGPLSGVRVIDLTRALAGPFCTMLLGDLGAEVIKVETPGKGDDGRQWGPPFVGKESCYFLSVNRNKKSITVNLKHPKGQDIIKKLANKSDVLIENYIPGKLDALGLGYQQIKQTSPKLIYCSVTGYGSDGPYSKKPGYDVIAAGIGGLLNITGPQGGEPCRVGVSITDITTGLYAAYAVLAAIIQRNKTGQGQKIDCNLLSTQVACLTNVASVYLNCKMQPERMGTATEFVVPYQAFKTADGYIVIGAGNDGQFRDLCTRMDLKTISDKERFKNNSSRIKHRNELIPLLEARFLQKSTNEWLSKFEECRFPCGPINDLPQTFANEQVKHNNLVMEMMHAREGPIKIIGPAVKFGDGSNVCSLPPPYLGQHTTEVLHEILHLSKEEIRSLEEDNVF